MVVVISNKGLKVLLMLCSLAIFPLPVYIWSNMETVPSLHFSNLNQRSEKHKVTLEANSNKPLYQRNAYLLETETISGHRGFAYQDYWVPIYQRSQDLTMVFSAYYDDVGKPAVRIVATGKTGMTRPVTCRFTYKQAGVGDESVGKVKNIMSWHGKSHRSKWIACPVESGVPVNVTIITSDHTHTTIPVHYMKKGTYVENTMNICVRALHNNYSNVVQLIEFIELYKLLGATHFTFYNESVSSEVSQLLNMYSERREVTVLKQNLPEEVHMESNGQKTNIQECLMRSRGYFKYVTMVDLDEYIIPREHKNLLELADLMDTKWRTYLKFARLNHCTNYPDNETVSSYLSHLARKFNVRTDLSTEMVTQLKTLRAVLPCRGYQKGKMILRPWNVHEAQIHSVRNALKGYSKRNIRHSVAVVHHFRWCYEDYKTLIPWLGPCGFQPFPKVELVSHKYLKPLSLKVVEILKLLQSKS